MHLALLSLFFPAPRLAEVPLANARVYIVRHAEKPAEGDSLTPEGFKRAEAYVGYFRKDPMDGSKLTFTKVFAAKDSKKSMRPRLTIEPLCKSYKLPIDSRFTDKDPEAMATELKSKWYGNRILVSWRHGEIPALLEALGAKSTQFVPEGKWPNSVYDRVIELKFDAAGKLDEKASRMIKEHLMPGDEN